MGTGRKRGEGGREERLTVGRAALPLAVIAVIVSCDQGRVHVDLVGDFAAETVTRETHCCG